MMDRSLEEERQQENPSGIDVLQGEIGPEGSVDGECSKEIGSPEATQEKAGEVLHCGFREVVDYLGYELNTNVSYGRGRYNRRNCQQYSCRVGSCRKTFATWEETRVHLSQHGKFMRKHYICSFPGCRRTFLTKVTAGNHVNFHSKNRKANTGIVKPPTPRTRFLCNFDGCRRKFGEDYALACHARLHDCDTPYLCEIRCCILRFASKEERDEHVTAHRNGDAFVCTFDGCGMSFSSHPYLQLHCSTIHTGEKPFRCSVTACGIRVSTKFLLDVHSKTHSLLRQYVCTYEGCDKRYKQLSSLELHLLTHSSAKCTFLGCGERFRDKETMEKHVLIHTGEKPFPCTADGCGKRFTNSWGLVTHRRTHKAALQKTKCEYDGCEEMVTVMLRKAHILRYHGTKVLYQCAIKTCGLILDSKASYDAHVRFCKPKINFICVFEGCSKEFNDEDQFMDHYRNHSGVELKPPSG